VMHFQESEHPLCSTPSTVKGSCDDCLIAACALGHGRGHSRKIKAFNRGGHGAERVLLLGKPREMRIA